MRACHRALIVVVISLPLLVAEARAEPCHKKVEVLSASATYKTRLFKGKPTRKDATIKIEVRSTATTAISAVELAIFLGASLQVVTETRPEALPTLAPRQLEGGGLAFRSEVRTVIDPRSTRFLTVERAALPLDEDVYSITAVTVSCKEVVQIAQGQIAIAARKNDDSSSTLSFFAIAVSLVILLLILVRLLK